MSVITDKFYEVTGYDIESYFNRFIEFINTQYPKLVNYYEGGTLDAASFDELTYLLKESNKIEGIFEMFSDNLLTLDMWQVLDTFEDAFEKLNTASNLSRWLKSSRVSIYSSEVVVSQMLRTGENFEMAASNYDKPDPQNDWVDITVNNTIAEDEYDLDGGTRYKMNFQNSGTHGVDNVIDSLDNQLILGKDIAKEWVIEKDADGVWDLRTVKFQEACKQAFGILTSTMQGDIPEFVDLGIAKELIGSSQAMIEYPILFKNLSNLFATDSRWKDLRLMEMSIVEDSLFIEVQATTILGEKYTTNIPLSNSR